MIRLNPEKLRDKIYACWMGKNMGGTMGTPYEGTRELLDIQGFVTKEGEVLPNDDLDLQLVWLKAVQDYGPNAINERLLGEYWITYIGPNWNEYGIGKGNLREGILPPLSGEINNDAWKHSNGAWIRTEIWATLFPADPEKAIRYAYYDACVDHGYGEGTYGAIFVAAMESAAFVIQNVHELLELGLSKIPADCRVARAVRLVMNEYEKGTDWKTVREMLVQDSADIGWFQAPANIAYVVLGLLYGEGDFKRSMILAINCGDDTDCTGATIGALMGIMRGTEGLPADWMKYLGEDIASICLLNGHGRYPTTITQLTDAVMNLLPVTMYRLPDCMFKGSPYSRTTPVLGRPGEPEDLTDLDPAAFCGTEFVDSLSERSPYSFVIDGIYCEVLVEYDTVPRIAPNGTLTGRISVRNLHVPNNYIFPESKHYMLRWLTAPEWTVESKTNLQDIRLTKEASRFHSDTRTTAFTIHAGNVVQPVNRVVLEVTSVGRSMPVYVPMTILG